MSKFLTDTLDGIKITRAKDVEKHGEHDQSSHGSWAHGVEVAPEIVRSTLERVKENGGLSVSLKDGSEPTKGFMVAKGKKFAAIVKAEEFFDEAKGAEILSSYMKQHKAEFSNSNNYLGLWHNTDDGQVYLDVSENIEDEGEAISRGRDRDQISIWDVANFKEIETGGTGGIEKTRSSRTARYVEHDRRADRRLRQRDLGEVSKTLKVIYFDYGLKPVIKHGEHDQSEHGNWARGFTENEIARIEEMRGLGPSLEDLDNVLKENDTEYTDEQLKLVVENDSDFYADATRDIDEKVDERLRKLQEEFPNHEYTEQEKATIYEDVQREMIDDYVETFRDNLVESQQIMEPSAQDPEELVPFFQEVYGVSHTGTNADGQEVSLNTNIGQVFRDGNSIYVRGDIVDEDGNMVGEVSRRFFQKDGVWNVEHEVLAIPDPAYQGTGFGKALIEQSEAWYTARGMGYIEVGTAWDGARHWARAGYDWKPDRVDENLNTIAMNVEYVDGFERGTPARAEFDALMSRATDGYNPTFSDESGNEYPAWDSVKDMKSDNFPLPADFANIGYTKGATEWAGKSLMYDLRLKYTKSLTAEGQKLLDGPIDHDGDGLIYDGTAREKPAPSGGNK
jgi:GNAT superfamily N-acetyltransferase/transcriptional regulator with XRE-family HTH domain